MKLGTCTESVYTPLLDVNNNYYNNNNNNNNDDNNNNNNNNDNYRSEYLPFAASILEQSGYVYMCVLEVGSTEVVRTLATSLL